MYPNTIYRVAVKAFVTDSQNRVLLVKESIDIWSLPGGGLDHGESPQDCLRREIQEELGIKDVVIGELAYTTTIYLDRQDMWMIWIVYRAKLGSTNFAPADGVIEARFIDVKELAQSNDIFEEAVIKVTKALI